MAAYAWLKHKAIGEFVNSLTKVASDRFWGYVRSQLKTDAKHNASAPPNERTYKGAFYGCLQYENYPYEWFITLVHDGVTAKIPVCKTNLLSGVSSGSLVEIDTQVGLAKGAEVVLRVRVPESKGFGGFAPLT